MVGARPNHPKPTPAPYRSQRCRPRARHPPPPHPRPLPRAPPQSPVATTLHPRDPAETTRRPLTAAAGGGQAGRQARRRAGGRAYRTWLAAHGGRRSAVGGRQARHADVAAAGQAVPALHAVSSGRWHGRRSAAWQQAAGGLRQWKRPRSGPWGRSPSNSLQPPPTPPHHPVPPPVPRETGKRPRGNSAKTQTEGSRAAGRAATTPAPVSPKRFFKNEKMARALDSS